MGPSPTGGGYWQASTSGELLAFGDAPDFGPGVSNPNRPIVGLAVLPTGGGTPIVPATPAGPPPPGRATPSWWCPGPSTAAAPSWAASSPGSSIRTARPSAPQRLRDYRAQPGLAIYPAAS